MAIIKDIIKTNDRLYRLSSQISELSEELNIPSFLVGGCVRDLLIDPNIDSVDIDIMVDKDSFKFSKKLSEKLKVNKTSKTITLCNSINFLINMYVKSEKV